MHNMSPLLMLLLMLLILGIMIFLLASASWLVLWLVGKIAHFTAHYSYFARTALGVFTIVCLGVFYGYFFGRWHLEINEIEYKNASVPRGFDGYRVVHISDLHLGSFAGHQQQLERFVDSINAQRPDLICFTGDLVTMGPQEVLPFVATLKRLKARDGVVSVLGNHDFLIYTPFDNAFQRDSAIRQLDKMERDSLGWNLLRNKHTVLRRGNDSISIVGVDNQNCANQGFRTIAKGDLKAAADGTDGFRILLSHDPSHWTGEVIPRTDIPLTLSGHTHNAQVSLFGWSPASIAFRETAGRYDSEGQTLYINSGLGCTAPFRFGAGPEITVITLRSN